MNNTLKSRVLSYLQNHNVATIATCNGGTPWATALFYTNNDFVLYFLSSPTSKHSNNLKVNPNVGVTIQEDYSDWLEIKGIQIEGVALEIYGEEEEIARKLYCKKFPVVGMLAHTPAAIVKALAKVRWYKIVPQRFFFIDNSFGLGNRDEIKM